MDWPVDDQFSISGFKNLQQFVVFTLTSAAMDGNLLLSESRDSLNNLDWPLDLDVTFPKTTKSHWYPWADRDSCKCRRSSLRDGFHAHLRHVHLEPERLPGHDDHSRLSDVLFLLVRKNRFTCSPQPSSNILNCDRFDKARVFIGKQIVRSERSDGVLAVRGDCIHWS